MLLTLPVLLNFSNVNCFQYEMEGLLPSRGDRSIRDIRTMNRCADIQETELQFDSARSSLAEGRLSLAEPPSLDTKGGERGALPSGRDKYEKCAISLPLWTHFLHVTL